MRNNIFIKCIYILAFIIFAYSITFISLHFFTPKLPEVSISVSSLSTRPEARNITFSLEDPPEKYAFLVYEERHENDWQFSPTSPYKPSSDLLNIFLPPSKKYFFYTEGSSDKKEVHFTLTSKYPIQTTSTREHVFHVEYIQPFTFFPFSTFYYSTHYTFFVDPLI
ncbi:MAG: hypothetical protein ACRCSG_05815 [Cellulosilyticaceae bacterium]